MIKCEECKRWFKTKRGHDVHYNRMHKYIKRQEELTFDTNEIKVFITSEIRRVFNDFKKSINYNNNTENRGILPIRIAKMPVFNPFESDKRLVIKELKEQLEVMVKDGIGNVLQEIGSFDEQITFLEVPIGILA